MKITKLGHCCLLIEERVTPDLSVRVLTDPGSYTTLQNEIKNIDVILITHEHADHLHIESVKKILENNPKAKIITNSSVNKLLEEVEIMDSFIVEDGKKFDFNTLVFDGFGTTHAEIHSELPRVQNTGYKIGERFFYPGDSLEVTDVKAEILALPVSGPWIKISEAIDYCIKLAPKVCFPVHDGFLNDDGRMITDRNALRVLPNHDIEFKSLEIGKETEF